MQPQPHATPGIPASFPPSQQRVIVLVGPPGSGKSTLADLLQPDYHRISQDVRALAHVFIPALGFCMITLVQALGSRPKCLAAAEAAMQQGCCVVIDRCNFDADQRSTWVRVTNP
jgi:predicted kinase